MLKEQFDQLLAQVLVAAQRFYGDRLVTLAVFGSVARGSQRFDSDVDLLVVCEHLPAGRSRRIAEFRNVEEQLEPMLASLDEMGIKTSLSAIVKSPAEVQRGGLLFLDFIEDARLLYDRGGFFREYLNQLRDRLLKLGARRIWRGNAWYWDLKPDFKAGDVFEI